MIPYNTYQLYQAERCKSRTELRGIDDRMGELSAGVARRRSSGQSRAASGRLARRRLGVGDLLEQLIAATARPLGRTGGRLRRGAAPAVVSLRLHGGGR